MVQSTQYGQQHPKSMLVHSFTALLLAAAASATVAYYLLSGLPSHPHISQAIPVVRNLPNSPFLV